MTNQVTVNENLVQMDNLLRGLNLLYEEIETRKESYVSEDSLRDLVNERLNSRVFTRIVTDAVVYEYTNNIYQEVSNRVMKEIDRSIDTFINDRVNAALKEAGIPIPPKEVSTNY